MARPLTSVRAKRRLIREEGDSLRERTSERVPERAHVSVMTQEVLEALALRNGERVLDATGGAGGHSEAILTKAEVSLLTLDADPEAVAQIRARLAPFGARAEVLEANFRDIESVLASRALASIDKALFDLGWNRGQLSSGRGFSFTQDEPLSMSYGPVPASGFHARDIVNTWSEEAIADTLFGYGEERYARRIAKAVVEARTKKPLETTGELVAVIERATPAAYRRGRIHPATRSFQALRIAVNDEFGSLEKGLESAWRALAPRGRMVVISFHSGEDRIVKKRLASFAAEDGTLLYKKPLTPTDKEMKGNPASRSAKLRAIEKN